MTIPNNKIPKRLSLFRLNQLSIRAQDRSDRESNKEGSVPIDYNDFLGIMTTKMSERDTE